MAQQVKALRDQPEDLSVIPQTHMVDGENGFFQVVL